MEMIGKEPPHQIVFVAGSAVPSFLGIEQNARILQASGSQHEQLCADGELFARQGHRPRILDSFLILA
jgi:hypothetical protein